MLSMDKFLRLLDANYNRGREALRLLEDYARFVLDDPHLSKKAKQLRHELSKSLSEIPEVDRLAARDITSDVGTNITTPAEQIRTSELAVVTAAAQRLTEALRSLEEYSKINVPQVALQIEKLRYRAYDLENQILLRARPKLRLDEVRLYVLLTEKLCKLPILEVAQQALAGGADCIQLREKDKTDPQSLDLANRIANLCHEAGALVIMNDRPDLAVLAGADGVHLGQDDLPVAQARKIATQRMIVGKSTHSIAEVQAALTEQPDYLALGSIFPSPTKPQVPCCGTKLIEQVRQVYSGPLFAIGGVTLEIAHQALAAGATGLALCQALCDSESPQTTCRDILKKLTSQ